MFLPARTKTAAASNASSATVQLIAMLLGVSTLFNYFDRLALSVAGLSLRQVYIETN